MLYLSSKEKAIPATFNIVCSAKKKKSIAFSSSTAHTFKKSVYSALGKIQTVISRELKSQSIFDKMLRKATY